MPVCLGDHVYGKSRIRMTKVIRKGDQHDLRDLTVSIKLGGDFTDAHVMGDNSRVLPTDTMKNTVYALARNHSLTSIEEFAKDLAQHFYNRFDQITLASVAIEATPWNHIVIDGKTHPHTFDRDNSIETTTVRVERSGLTINSGMSDLVILKTTDSGFSDFLHDEYTKLEDTDDRLLGTSLTTTWNYMPGDHDYPAARCLIRNALVGAFAAHHSKSVQHTLYAMGQQALDCCAIIECIHLSMPNQHRLLVDLSPFGLDNPNVIFQPVDEPFGLIEATVQRT